MILWNQLPCICFLNHNLQTIVSSGLSFILLWQFFQIWLLFFSFLLLLSQHQLLWYQTIFTILFWHSCIVSDPSQFDIFCDKVLSWWHIDSFGPNSLEHSKSQVGNKWFTWTLISQMFFFLTNSKIEIQSNHSLSTSQEKGNRVN